VEVTFNLALERPPAEREAYLRQACGDDTMLMAEVRELLAANEAAEGFMPEGVPLSAEVERELARLKPEEEGEMIGPYKLREQIGEGGFGTVWVADQEKPVRRRVALKIIKLGMDTKEVIARFEQERQALAMMDHTNIARVLDAGATQYGRPYFVMELVRGMKITDYCDQQQLPTPQRIELFITVCQAVQHAHQKGIIHRDLKPSNILVTINDGKAVPKVIDFGVAKATQGRLSEQTVYTLFQQMIGTPLYMSPEQAELTSLDIDTRSDIYALGVLLYELLTGHTPIEQDTLARLGMDEIRRIIREVDPPRPSARLKTLDGAEMTTVGKRRNTEPAKLPGAIRGDIDWIVMKCLEKDRSRRYDTANGLALDLQRHLRNEVVIARPPTTAYLLGKLVRRNKLAFAAGAAIATSLVFGIAASVWQAVRAEREAARARAAEQSAVAALDQLRASAPAFAEQARGLVAREQFDDAIAKLDDAIKLRPDVADYLLAKADLLQCQLKLGEAAAVYRQALGVRPGFARAEASAKLCDELLASPLGEQGKLTRESLAKLHLAMQTQQRSAAELMPVARLLGEEKKLIVEYWLARLKDLPVSADKPLKDRLTVREDGRLALDLSDTKVLDLTPLAGVSLATLDLSKCSELADLSPLRGLALVELNVSNTRVADLAPLREMHTLEKLNVSSSKVTTLAALEALRLRSLAFRECPIRDLNPIRKMPLEAVDLYMTRVTDLSPLVGMPIKSINLTGCPVLDFSPLTQLPLEKCLLQHNRITDLGVLRGKPLKELVLWGCVDARNYTAIAQIQTLELLVLPSEFRTLPGEEIAAISSLRKLPNLRQIGATIMNRMGVEATGSKDIFWQDWDREQAVMEALRKNRLTFTLSKLPDGSYKLEIPEQPVTDLSILKGAPITELRISSKLLTSLAPLRELPLTALQVTAPKVKDFSPLRGLPLRDLFVDACNNEADVAPLAEIPSLERLTVPLQSVNAEALRRLPKLQWVAFNLSRNGLPAATADDFWKIHDLSQRLRAAGVNVRRLNAVDDGAWDLDVGDSNLKDLSILAGAPISALRIDRTQVTDLAPLHGMPLKRLEIAELNIPDLSPLQGMALEELQATAGTFTDLSVLRGMPLKNLFIAQSKGISDLSPLRGLPLVYVKLHGCDNLTDLSPLVECKSLQLLTVPLKATNIGDLRELRLQRIGYRDGALGGEPDRTAPEFWKDFGEPWAAALQAAGIGYGLGRNDDGRWGILMWSRDFSDCSVFQDAQNISSLHLSGCKVRDLTPLRGLPLTYLHIGNNPVTDLAPLREIPLLKSLWVSGSPATDFTPLRGMKLHSLALHNSQFSDLSLLAGMPLKTLDLNGCKNVTDVAPLLEFPTLEQLTVPWGARNIGLLRKLPNLRLLSYDMNPTTFVADKTVAEFWREYDASPWIARLTDAGISLAGVKRLDDGTWEANLAGPELGSLELLRDTPFSIVRLGNTAVTNLEPLRGLPLKRLDVSGTNVTDVSPLAGCKGLTGLVLPAQVKDIEFLRSIPQLARLSFAAKNGEPDKTAAEFWKEYDSRAWLRALEGAGAAVKWARQLPDGTWDLNLDNSTISDLTLLRGVPISVLSINTTAIKDLTPLRGSPIKILNLSNTPVADLGPLEGMPLEQLLLRNTPVANVSVLRGMPLTGLYLAYCRSLTDLSPLAECKTLTSLTLPPGAKDIAFLRNFPKLQRLSFQEIPQIHTQPTQTAAEFWKEYDAGRK